jgi:hypothetical protein
VVTLEPVFKEKLFTALSPVGVKLKIFAFAVFGQDPATLMLSYDIAEKILEQSPKNVECKVIESIAFRKLTEGRLIS